MAKISYLAAQVPATPTYNWSAVDSTLGDLDLGVVSTDAPGVGAGTGINNITTSIAPRPIFQPVLGQIVRAWEPTLGFGEFIYLSVPTSTAMPLGTLVGWDTFYNAVAIPAKATSQKTGLAVAVCVSSTVTNSGAGITSNTSSKQYAWFQCGGQVQTLKTAINVTPVAAGTLTGAAVYVSTTAGRVYATASAGGQILGARFFNTATVTTTASCILVYFDGRSTIEGA